MSVQESTKRTPAALMFGHELRTPVDLATGPLLEWELCSEPRLDYLHNLHERSREVQELTRHGPLEVGSWEKQVYNICCRGEVLHLGSKCRFKAQRGRKAFFLN